MIDKPRHRPLPTPKGFLSNWALAACIAGAMMLVSLANTLI